MSFFQNRRLYDSKDENEIRIRMLLVTFVIILQFSYTHIRRGVQVSRTIARRSRDKNILY